jgi:hypothetical protein
MIIVVQLVKKLGSFYRCRKFISIFMTARHWSLSWAILILSTPSHPFSLRCVLILSPSISRSSELSLYYDLPTKMLYAFLIFLMPSTCPAYHIFLDLDHANNILWSVQVTKPLIMQSSPSLPLSSSFKSKYLTQHPVLKQVSRPYFL